MPPFLKALLARHADFLRNDNTTTTGNEDGEDNNDNTESVPDDGAELKQEIEQNSHLVIEDFRRLVAAQDTSVEVNRLGPILMKFAPEDLAGQFLVECVEMVRQGAMKPSVVDELISTVGLAPRRALSKLFDKIQTLIEVNADEDTWFRCLELLPIIIPLLEKPRLNPDELDDEASDDYKSLIKDILLNVDYKKPICISVLSVVGELNLQCDDLADILSKAMEMSANVPPTDLPSFCYYALLASRRCSTAECASVFGQILTAMTQFEEQNRGSTKLRPIIGTVLHHLTYAVRQDPALLKEVLRLARTPPLRFLHSVFFSSFLLALSAQPPYSDSTYPCLRNHILRHLKFKDRCSQAFWLDKLGSAVGGVRPITEVILLATKESYTDAIAISAVHFAFFMLDALTGTMTLSPVASRACQHAVSVITQAFTSAETAQEPILSLLFERLLSSGSATPIRGRFLLDIVRQLVVKGPHFLMTHSAKLRQLIDYLPSFPLATAEDLIKTLMLLFRVNISLRDALLILLRKLLFSRKLEHRLLAAKGYIQFLLNFKVVGGVASTQPGASTSFSASQMATVRDAGRKTGDRVQNSANRTGNDALCLEILGILKRCLEQQAEVRRVIYQSLPQVLHTNSQLVDPVLQLLSNHLKEFVVERETLVEDEDGEGDDEPKKDGDVPILFGKCFKNGGTLLVEPIADLIFCLSRCLAETGRLDPDTVPEICDQLRKKLSRLAFGIVFANIHELMPDKADPEQDGPKCRLIVCTLAALLETGYNEFQVSSGDGLLNLTGIQQTTQQPTSRGKRCLHVLTLFHKMLRICDAIPTPLTLQGGKKPGRPGKKEGGVGKKKDGDKKKGDGVGSSSRLTTLVALLSKNSQTNFIDLGFVERYVGDVLKALDGDPGTERLTRSERDHDHFMGVLTFLMQSAAKCQFTDTRRLIESAYRVARQAMAVVKGQYDNLPEDGRLFSGAAIDFLHAVFTQLVQNKDPHQPNTAVASMRNLLCELNNSAEEDEGELRLAFVSEFFQLLRNRVGDETTGETVSSKDAAASREFSTLLSLIKSISSFNLEPVESDLGGHDDNMSAPALRACDGIQTLCREKTIRQSASCRSGFDFLLDCCYRSERKYRTLLLEITEDVAAKLGRVSEQQEDGAGAPARGSFASIRPENAMHCAVVPILRHVELELTDASFVLELIRLWLLVADDNPNASLNPANPGQKVPKIRDNFWRAVFEHQYALVKAMKDILDSDISSQQVLLNALKTLTKLYDSLFRSTRIVLSSLAAFSKDKPVGWTPPGFNDLVRATGADFQSVIYAALRRFQEMCLEAAKAKAEGKNKKKNKKNAKKKQHGDEMEEDEGDEEEADEEETGNQGGQRSVTPRGGSSLETRLLPSLIFAIEQYEQMILRLSKRKGLGQLGANMKRSTSHDFRILTHGGDGKSPPKRSQVPKSQSAKKKTPTPDTAAAKTPLSGGRRRPLSSRQGSRDEEGDDADEESIPPQTTAKKKRKLLQSQPQSSQQDY